MYHRLARSLALVLIFISLCGTQELPLYSLPLSLSSEYPVYHLTAEVGTPAQPLKMLLDINSAAVSLPVGPYCERNVYCYANNSYYPSESSTSSVPSCTSTCKCIPIQTAQGTTEACGVTLYYSQYSALQTSYVEAIQISDVISAGPSATTSFAGIYSESTAFSAFQADGIFGFGPQALLPSGLSSWFHSLVNDNVVKNIFSLCMDSGGGVLILGGTDVSLYSGLLKYTPIVSTEAYNIHAEEIEINGATIEVDEDALNPVIIDSTSADTILSVTAYTQLIYTINQVYCNHPNPPLGLCGEKNLFNGFCFPIVKDLFFSYPAFSFILQSDVNVTITPKYYLYSSNGYFCSSIIGATNYQSGIVFGTNLLRRYYVAFDLELQSIGFSPSVGCSDASYVLEYISGDGQSTPTGKELDSPLKVIVTGFKDGLPVPGVEVTWQVNQGEGKIVSHSDITDENGISTAVVEVGLTIGQNVVTASLQSAIGSPVVFTATGEKGAWFYVYNTVAMLVLYLLLSLVIYYQKSFKKKKFSEEFSEKIDELASLGIGAKEDEKVSLLKWARLHDYPVRSGGTEDGYSSIN